MWAGCAICTMNRPISHTTLTLVVALSCLCTTQAQYTGGPGRGEDMAQVALSTPPTAHISVRVHLEGPYDPATGLMNDGLRSLVDFPLSEPYTDAGYPHVGGGGETIAPALLSTTGADAIVDWMVLELRGTASPYAVLATQSVLVQRDGDLVAANGSNDIAFSAQHGQYRVAVRHRNHLGAMTNDALALGDVPVLLDLTLESTATFGNNARKLIEGNAPTLALWAGDSNFDGVIKYTGLNNDRDPLLLRIGGTVPTSSMSGYHPEDVNMDGMARYTGANNDRDPILLNVGGSVPTATRSAQLP